MRSEQQSTELNHAAHDVCSVVIRMRDGVELVADVHGQLTGEPRPVVLERTPYGKQSSGQPERHGALAGPMPRMQIAHKFMSAGFIYVVGDCRGTGQSQGTFTKYLQESDDGIDTINWLRAQPWCDGRIATTGFSYGAACQMAAIAAGAPLQGALFDCGGFFDAYESGIRQSGAFDLKQATWTHAQALRDALSTGDMDAAQVLRKQDLIKWLERGPWCTGHSPLETAPRHLSNLMRFWQGGEFDASWRHPALYASAAVTKLSLVPALFVTSWHDTSLLNTINAFSACNRTSGNNHQLVIGPWCHGAKQTTVAGQTDLGASAIPEAVLGEPLSDYGARRLHQMVANEQPSGPAVRYFEMGGSNGQLTPEGNFLHGGSWRTSAEWPPEGCGSVQFFLSDGELRREEAPEKSWQADWSNDPDNPVETLGGAINSGEPVMRGGMFDHSTDFPVVQDAGKVCSTRSDLVSVATPPLTEDLHVAGSVDAELFISTDVTDADITIKLLDCYAANGPCLNVADGILRLRYRSRPSGPARLTPGEITCVRVQAFPTANRFQAGHRLRLDLAASNFPHFDVNPQTGGPEGRPGPRRKAHLTIHSGPDHPSKLTLNAIGRATC